MRNGMSFRATAATVILFAIAMAYLESAVVVYLQGALGAVVGDIFPLRPAAEAGDLLLIEVGREVATIVMIATIGALVGRTGLERLAWAAVVFGVWDIGYYVWLQVFTGWPGSLATTDLLFLIPLPWVGPVWSPVLVSRRPRRRRVGRGGAPAERGGRPWSTRWHWVAGIAGGLIVIALVHDRFRQAARRQPARTISMADLRGRDGARARGGRGRLGRKGAARSASAEPAA